MTTSPSVLTIAGSDSSGGAGIQADIKTLSALGIYSASVITNVTAQNTCGVQAIHTLPRNIIEAQLRAVLDDLNITCVKIGMLNTLSTVVLVSEILKEYRPKHIILDPVMISSSGKPLLEKSAVSALTAELFPIATLVTPNIPEAAALLNQSPANSVKSMHQTIKALDSFGAQSTLLKGGHLEGDQCVDILLDNDKLYEFPQTKITTNNTHGTGCTLSSAITAYLALGLSVPEAVSSANIYLHKAIKQADILKVGKGSGPVHHFHNLW